jgi:hypothetical protein
MLERPLRRNVAGRVVTMDGGGGHRAVRWAVAVPGRSVVVTPKRANGFVPAGRLGLRRCLKRTQSVITVLLPAAYGDSVRRTGHKALGTADRW